MLTMRGRSLRLPVLILQYMLLWWPPTNGAAHAQQVQNQPESLAAAITGAQGGNSAEIKHIIAIAGPAQAIAILQGLFRSSQNIETKEMIASYLYRLGDKEDIYWDFMMAEATLAVESDAPFPHSYDPQGKMLDGFSPEFAAWANAHNLSVDAAVKAEWDRYNEVLILAATSDQRAVPVLRRGLSSPDQLIESVAPRGWPSFMTKTRFH